MQHEDTPIHPVCPPGGESCRSEAPQRSPSRASSGSPRPIRSEGEFRDRIMRVAARRAAGIRSRSVSSAEADGFTAVNPHDRPINRVVLLRRDRRLSERSPSRTSSKSPRPIRAKGELDERNRKVAARRAAGIQSRSVSPNEVAMRPNSSGHVDGYLSTTARIVKTMCQKAVGRHSKDGGGTPQALSPEPMRHAGPQGSLVKFIPAPSWEAGLGTNSPKGRAPSPAVVPIPIFLGAESKNTLARTEPHR